MEKSCVGVKLAAELRISGLEDTWKPPIYYFDKEISRPWP